MQTASPATPVMIDNRLDSPWPLAKRLAFRFLAVYFVLYAFPFPLDTVPVLNGYFGSMSQQRAWTPVIPWIAEHVFQIDKPINTQLGGSGDTMYHNLCIASFAI